MRMIAVILTFALSTQNFEAQAVNCTIMRDAHAAVDHSALTQHQHHAVHAGSITSSGDFHDWSSTAACDRTMICANAPAVPIMARSAVTLDKFESAISFVSNVNEPRTFSPEPPPPRA
jgi:hypothetical protein